MRSLFQLFVLLSTLLSSSTVEGQEANSEIAWSEKILTEPEKFRNGGSELHNQQMLAETLADSTQQIFPQLHQQDADSSLSPSNDQETEQHGLEDRRRLSTCTLVYTGSLTEGSTKSYDDGGASFNAQTDFQKSAGCDPSATIQHRIIGKNHSGTPTATIYNSGGDWTQVGPKWSSDCWPGDWIAIGETRIIYSGKVVASTRYLARRTCTDLSQSVFPDGNWYFINMDASMPHLSFSSYNFQKDYQLYQNKQQSFTTPAIATAGYDHPYLHQLYIVPDGRWHLKKCPESLAQMKACLDGDFKDMKVHYGKSPTTFEVDQFRFFYQNRDAVYDGHMRILWVIRDSSLNVVTYNLESNWYIYVEDVYATKANAHVYFNSGSYQNGPISPTNYNTQSWLFSLNVKMNLPDYNLFPPTWFSVYPGSDATNTGLFQFFVDDTSECATKGIVTSIDPVTSAMTFEPDFAFPAGVDHQKCEIKAGVKSLNSLIQLENFTTSQAQNLCFGTCLYQGHELRSGITWNLQPITIFKDFQPRLEYEEVGGIVQKPFLHSTQPCWETSRASVEPDTDQAKEGMHINEDYQIVFKETGPDATYQVQIQSRGSWCGYGHSYLNVPSGTDQLTFVVKSFKGADYLEFGHLVPTDANKLKFNQSQTAIECNPSQCDSCSPACADPCNNPCPPCNPLDMKSTTCFHSLSQSDFSVGIAKFKVDMPLGSPLPCNYCKFTSLFAPNGKSKGDEYVLEPDQKSLSASGENINGPQTASVSDWTSTPITTNCGRWSKQLSGKTLQQKITIKSTTFDYLKTEIKVECIFAECKNQKAMEVKEFFPKKPGGSVDIDSSDVVFYVVKQKEPLKTPLEQLEMYCNGHVQLTKMTFTLIVPGQADKILNASQAYLTYGLRIENQAIHVFTKDEQVIGHTVKVTVRFYSHLEDGWFIERQIRFSMQDGRCKLTQDEINAEPSGYIELRTSRAGRSVSKPLGDIFTYGPWALQQEKHGNFCGEVIYEWYDPTGEQPFIKVDFMDKVIKLEPDVNSHTGQFSNAAIRFSYKDYPRLHFNITVISTVEDCIIEQAQFALSYYSVTYSIGADQITQGLPGIEAQPDCEMTIKSFEFVYPQQEENLLELDIVTNALIVKKTENLSLYGTRVNAQLTMFMNEYPQPIRLSIDVKFRSAGPAFEGQDIIDFPTVMCSLRGSSWSFTMPDIVAQEQQELQIVLVQDQLVGDIFRYNRASNTLTITREYKTKFQKRQDCPIGKLVVITFQLTSSIIGVSRPAFVIDFQEDPLADGAYLDNNDENQNSIDDSYDSSLKIPSAEIESITLTGIVTVSFSHPQKVSEDTVNALESVSQKSQILQFKVNTVEGQTQDSVAFSWSLKNFDKDELKLQLYFSTPYEISMYEEHNELEIVFLTPGFFKRGSDLRPLPPDTKVNKNLPQQLNAEKAETLKAVAKAIGDSGSGTIILSVLIQQVASFSMNSLLSQVRSLSFITHLMMMQLNYAAGVSYFYSFLFEFVTYDMVPSEEVYAEIFAFESSPYSNQADNIGYGSSYTIENTGSLLLLLFALGLRHILFFVIQKLTKKFQKFKKLGKWAKRGQKGFAWAGMIDLLSEMYICVVFSLGINTSYFHFSTAAETFNNFFMIALFGFVLVVPVLVTIKLLKLMKAINQNPEKQPQSSVTQLEGGEKDPSPSLEQERDQEDNNVSFNTLMDSLEQNSASKFYSKAEALVAEHQEQLERIKKQQKRDKKVKERFGAFISSLADSHKLTPKQLARFVAWSYLRRLLQAILILSLYSFPVMQVLSSVVLNIFNIVVLLYYRPYKDKQDQVSEVMNSIASLLVLYCLMLFCGQLVGDKKALSDFGDLLIAISVTNLVINIIPLIYQLGKTLHNKFFYKIYRRIKNVIDKKKQLKALRVRLQQRSEAEKAFGGKIETRFNVAKQTNAQFDIYEKMYTDGVMNDHAVAIKTQQHYNLENQLDSDEDSPREEAQICDPYPLGAPVVSQSSNLLLNQFQASRLLEDASIVMDLQLSEINEERLDEVKSCRQSFDACQRPDTKSSLAESVTDFWGNTRYPVSAEEHNPLKKPTDPDIDYKEMQDEELVVLWNLLRKELMLFNKDHEALKASRADITTTKQEHIKFQDNQVESWIAIIIDTCQQQLDKIDEAKKQFDEEDTSDNNFRQVFIKMETQRLNRVSHDIGDIYYELLEIESREHKRHNFYTVTERDQILADFATTWKLPEPPIPSGEPPKNHLTLQERAQKRFSEDIGNKVRQKQQQRKKK